MKITYIDGEIVFTKQENAKKFKEWLLEMKWFKFEGKDLLWCNNMGNPISEQFDEPECINVLEGNRVILTNSPTRNFKEGLEHAFAIFSEKADLLDTERTVIHGYSVDGEIACFSFDPVKAVFTRLSDEEVEEILGFPMEKVDYDDYSSELGLNKVDDILTVWMSGF